MTNRDCDVDCQKRFPMYQTDSMYQVACFDRGSAYHEELERLPVDWEREKFSTVISLSRGDPEPPGSTALRNPLPKSPCVWGGAQGVVWVKPSQLDPQSWGPGRALTERYWSAVTFLQGTTRTSRTPCQLRAPCCLRRAGPR